LVKVSEKCLRSVWEVSERCLGGVWEVPGWDGGVSTGISCELLPHKVPLQKLNQVTPRAGIYWVTLFVVISISTEPLYSSWGHKEVCTQTHLMEETCRFVYGIPQASCGREGPHRSLIFLCSSDIKSSSVSRIWGSVVFRGCGIGGICWLDIPYKNFI
jgi:hypothetical protein